MLARQVLRLARRTSLKLHATTRRTLTAFRDRTDGIAAVEFALIVPIMALMMIGSIEMSQAVTVDRRVSMTAAAAGDLVARIETDIQTTEVHDIAKIGSWLMKPFDGTKFKIKMSLVTIPCPSSGPCPTTDAPQSDPNLKTRWMCEFDGANPNAINCTCPLTTYTLPSAGLMKYGDSIVVSDVEYKYQPLFFDYFMKNATGNTTGIYTLKEKLHLKTRGVCTKLNFTNGSSCACFD